MIRPGSSVSKAKKKANATAKVAPGKRAVPDVKVDPLDLLEIHDYVGAITVLEFERKSKKERPQALMWLAYCCFHGGDYQKALNMYDEALKKDQDPQVHAYKACCFYALCRYEEAEEAANLASDSDLKTRLLLHAAHKKNDEGMMMANHQKLKETVEDQLSLAAIQYLRSHFQEATDIYKRLLVEDREHLAVNVYVALCYYKLDYYDVALEILQTYISVHPRSITAVNLKACTHYQLYNGKAAEAELRVLQQAVESGDVYQDNDILRHNLVVFRNGENALQVLPPLLDIVPEARLNLVIYHLRVSQVTEAYNLVKDLEPSVPREYILKGVAYAALGQANGSKEHLRIAQQLFQLVGASPSEQDTIPGRQCMASCFFLLRQFDDVLVYLKSVKQYFASEDDFNWNYGIALASAGEYKEAKEALLMIQNEKYLQEFCYLSWLTRCYIMNGEPSLAWETYRATEGNESFNLLHLLANDCYQQGHFYFACRAFDVLERLDPDPEFWEGKRGAAAGVFQAVCSGSESTDKLQEVIALLRNAQNPQVERMIAVIKGWARENRVRLE